MARVCWRGTSSPATWAPRTGRPSRREWRLLAVAGVLVILLGTVLSWLIPSDGPLGPTGDTESDWVDVLITLVLALLLVNGLRKGKRTAWRWGSASGSSTSCWGWSWRSS
ncbi:hypothetical protein ACFQV8_20135 [Pseudonocardia benzenivorans]